MTSTLFAVLTYDLVNRTRRADLSAFTVGVEHELFLIDADAQPATENVSQEFLRSIAARDGWGPRIIKSIYQRS